MGDIGTSKPDHFTSRQVRELLALASSEADARQSWLLEIGDWEYLEVLLAEMCTGRGQEANELLQATCSPHTPIELLISVKNAAKRLAGYALTAEQKAAALLLYHLSVAAALANHGRNITSKDLAKRLTLYQDLAAGISDDVLATIFEKAIASLRSAKS